MKLLCPYCYGRFEGEREHCPHCNRKLLPVVLMSVVGDPNSWDYPNVAEWRHGFFAGGENHEVTKGFQMKSQQFGTFVVELHEHAAVLMTMDFEGQPVAFTIESHAEAQHLVDAAEAIRGMVNFKDAPGADNGTS